jgi:hypothetical protein
VRATATLVLAPTATETGFVAANPDREVYRRRSLWSRLLPPFAHLEHFILDIMA